MTWKWSRPEEPTLWLTPYFLAKYTWFRDRGDTEVSGYGLSDEDNVLRFKDFIVPQQVCSATHTTIDEDDWLKIIGTELMSEYPAQCYHRLWAHTHPGFGPDPSSIDEDTFASHMQNPTWGIMLIYSTNGTFYARFCQKNPRLVIEMNVEVDWSGPYYDFTPEIWEQQYQEKVSTQSPIVVSKVTNAGWRTAPYQSNDDYWINRDHQRGIATGGDNGFATRKKLLAEADHRSGAENGTADEVIDDSASDDEYISYLTREKTVNEPSLSMEEWEEFNWISDMDREEFCDLYPEGLPEWMEPHLEYLPPDIREANKWLC